jgi:hypothetical protein
MNRHLKEKRVWERDYNTAGGYYQDSVEDTKFENSDTKIFGCVYLQDQMLPYEYIKLYYSLYSLQVMFQVDDSIRSET